MITIYVLIRDGEIVSVAPSLSADAAAAWFAGVPPFTLYQGPGEIYACKLSEHAAGAVRDYCEKGQGAKARSVILMYSHGINKCTDNP